MRDWPKIHKVSELPQFYTRVSQLYQMFKTMGYEADLQGKGLLCDLTSKIPENMLESWGKFIVSRGQGDPTVELFYLWLKGREEALRFTPLDQSGHSPQPSNQVRTKTLTVGAKPAASGAGPAPKKHCVFCDTDGHWIDGCSELLAKSPSDRLSWYKSMGRCFLCAKNTHRSAGCFLKMRCGKCGKSHSSMLHEAFEQQSSRPPPPLNPTVTTTPTVSTPTVTQPPKLGVALVKSSSRVFLQTLPVKVHTPRGRRVESYGMLDNGSQATLIEDEFAREIGLNGPKAKLNVSGINDDGTVHNSRLVSFWLSDPLDPSQPPLKVEAWTFDRAFGFPVCEAPPGGTLSWLHVTDLNLRTVDSSEIKILIGANVPRAHVQLELRQGPESLPMAVRTPLGWTVMGVECEEADKYPPLHVSVCSYQTCH